jgi:ABC-2 type transport system permease protein
MQRSVARREGSPFTGLGPVFMKEFADHLSSARMMVLMLFVIAFGALPVGLSLQELRNVTESDPFLFLRIFTSAPQRIPFSFTAALSLVIPLLAIGLGFDAVNSEFNRRTLSRVLSQPIYRDALLLGKFLGALATLAVALVALWRIVLGAGLLLLGLPPRGVEVARGIGFLVVAIAYGGVWLAVSILFSVIFRSTATSALCALGVWLFFTILWPLVVPVLILAVTPTDVAMGMGRLDETLAMIEMQSMLERLSPNTLFGEAVIGLLNPETRTLGPIIPSQMRGAIMGAPLPFDQSLILIWPQITGLIAGMIVVFAAAYVVFQREEIRA